MTPGRRANIRSLEPVFPLHQLHNLRERTIFLHVEPHDSGLCTFPVGRERPLSSRTWSYLIGGGSGVPAPLASRRRGVHVWGDTGRMAVVAPPVLSVLVAREVGGSKGGSEGRGKRSPQIWRFAPCKTGFHWPGKRTRTKVPHPFRYLLSSRAALDFLRLLLRSSHSSPRPRSSPPISSASLPFMISSVSP